jgi:DNA-binding transcriptional MocR family regulator
MFFAYRGFTADPDRILRTYGYGRAHHRAIHFINRAPGTTVNNLLSILGVTKQSLNRVLRTLVEDGLVESRVGTATSASATSPDRGGRGAGAQAVEAQRNRMRAAFARPAPTPWPGSAPCWKQMMDPR